MVNRDYTKEIGMPSGQKKVPKPVAAIFLLGVAVGGWYVVSTVVERQESHASGHAEKVIKTDKPGGTTAAE